MPSAHKNIYNRSFLHTASLCMCTLKIAGFSLLLHFIGLFLIFLFKFWVIFLTQMLGLACWVFYSLLFVDIFTSGGPLSG